MKSRKTPPAFADRLLEWYCNPEMLEDLQGDLYERYRYKVERHGPGIAAFLYWLDVLRFIKPYTIKKRPQFTRSSFMLANYFKTSYRNLRKHSLNTLVNIFGLTLGFSAFILICLYVNDELKYDRYLPNADRIFRITMSIASESSNEHVAWSMPAIGPELVDRYPEVEACVALVNEKVTVKNDAHMFREDKFFVATADYFKVFSYPFIKGHAKSSFIPGCIVLTAETAKKYFGSKDPINQTLEVDNKSYKVTGILKDLPSLTDLQFDALICIDDINNYGWTYNYMLLKNKNDAIAFHPKLDQTFEDTVQPEFDDYNTKGHYYMEALPDVHFGSEKLFDTPKSSRSNIYIFFTTALLILLVAGINYMNISLANATNRQAEVGIRKSIGAQNSQLKSQFLLESFLICFLSISLAIGFVIFCLPYLNLLTHKQIEWSEIFFPPLTAFLVIVTILLGILSGSYPAFYLTSVKPTEALKGKMAFKSKSWLRKSLVIVQFTVSMILLISTILIFRQLQLIQSKSLGYNSSKVVVLDIPNDKSTIPHLEQLKYKFLEYPFVKSASFTGFNSWPTSDPDIDVYEVYSNNEWQTKPFNNINVDEDYFKTLNLHFIEGHGFSNQDINKSVQSVVVNQALVKNLGWEHPLEQKIVYETGSEYQVIGVIKDFHFQSIRDEVDPMLIFPNRHNTYAEKLLLTIGTDNWLSSIEALEEQWKINVPDQPFEFQFLDHYIQQQYQSEKTMKEVFIYFMIIAVSIACLGLFSLIALTTTQKLKEVGIRKVFGAKTWQLCYTLCRDFLVLVLISIAIATPLAIIGMNHWLNRFVEKIQISFDVFLIAGGLTLLMAMMTMAFHVVKASLTNPTTLLRYE